MSGIYYDHQGVDRCGPDPIYFNLTDSLAFGFCKLPKACTMTHKAGCSWIAIVVEVVVHSG